MGEVRDWAPDAFIKPIQIPANGKLRSEARVQPKPKTKVEPTPLAADASDVWKSPAAAAPEKTKTKEFRVRIVSYTTTLEPTEVATLLRLGNEVPLKTARLTNQTVYFTDTFDRLEDAKKALDTCVKRGFQDAEIEVIYQ